MTTLPPRNLRSRSLLFDVLRSSLRAEAIRRHARRCRTLLVRDPAARPSGTQILDAVGDNRPRRIASDTTAPFVGRQRELALLEKALVDSRNQTVTVRVHASSGMGKSALLRRFLENHRGRETTVLQGRCYEQEAVPFKALDGAIDCLGRYLQSLPAGAPSSAAV